MCGIAGFYGFKNDDLIKKISKEIEHRGPDGEGFYWGEKVTLLNRRLAIIDRKGGDQPIYNEDKTIVVVYNGEIYNYQELRADLEKEGHTFKTHSDTEVIVHGYEQWGTDCFDLFNGMFAVALFDKNKDELVLARDHFGIKPLYYASVGEHHDAPLHQVIFSSEIKPIINSGLIKKEPNDRVIYRYLNYRIHDDSEDTFFKNVYKLMPGELMIVNKNGIQKKYFTKLKEELLCHSGERSDTRISGQVDSGYGQQSDFTRMTTEKFKEKLINAIRMRLVSEVPVGTALSGGLDSSTVVAVINDLLKDKVKEAESVGKIQNTFSAVFPNSSNNEEKYIDALLEKTKHIKSHKIYPKPEEFFEDLEDFVKTQEEPTISTGPYAQYKVMQEAHKFVTVLLDGQGADEMMAGYLPYYFVYLNQLKKQGNFMLLGKEIISSKDIVGKYLYQKLLLFLGLKQSISTKSLLNKKFISEFSNERFVINNTNLKERLVEDIFHNSLPSLLRYEDKNTMRFSIEGRVPFLDYTLLRYLFTLSDSAIIENGWNKNILRKSVTNLLPKLIYNRRNKIGFTTPEHEWFIRMKNRIYSYFLSESFAKRKYFKQTEILKKFEDFIKGKNDDTMVFWRLLNLEIWFRMFFDPATLQIEERKNRESFSPNPGKNIKIEVDKKTYYRFPIKTDVIQKGDSISKKIIKHVLDFLSQTKLENKDWFIVLSEKIVAISQGRSYFIWDITPSFWAQTLSKFVTKTPYGIGLGSPWTMQLAIQEAGLMRILLASVASILAKPIKIKGLFYKIAGSGVNAIDGPTEYSLYPSNVSAKLPPKNPEKVARDIKNFIADNLPKQKLKNFQGVVIIDANDLGRNVLGNSTTYDAHLVEKIFTDNPMGQAAEQTPLVMVFSI